MTTMDPVKSSHSSYNSRQLSRAAPGETLDDFIIRRKQEFEQRHKRISIYTNPILVCSCFVMFAYSETRAGVVFLYGKGLVTLGLLIAIVGMTLGAYQVQGPHQQLLYHLGQAVMWYSYWVLLGIASALGLGTGLHTFILFLGPYIAEVTRAAYECNGTDQLTRDLSSYRLQCPYHTASMDGVTAAASSSTAVAGVTAVSLWRIYSSIRWESFAWGTGTALGELPPYFVARTVALSGDKDDNLAAFEAGLNKPAYQRTIKEQSTLWIYTCMKRLGFLGILLFASIPNPLFDLAGIMCGHFLVPFATFFGATFVGKACVKASFQSMVVILAFSNDTLNLFLSAIQAKAPTMHMIIERVIHEQAHKIGTMSASGYDRQTDDQINIYGVAWNVFLSLMVCYFVVSSVESLGLAHMRREHQEEIRQLQKHRQTEMQ